MTLPLFVCSDVTKDTINATTANTDTTHTRHSMVRSEIEAHLVDHRNLHCKNKCNFSPNGVAARLPLFLCNLSAAFKPVSDVVFILLINVKMATVVAILTFMSRINLYSVELSMKKEPEGQFCYHCKN